MLPMIAIISHQQWLWVTTTIVHDYSVTFSWWAADEGAKKAPFQWYITVSTLVSWWAADEDAKKPCLQWYTTLSTPVSRLVHSISAGIVLILCTLVISLMEPTSLFFRHLHLHFPLNQSTALWTSDRQLDSYKTQKMTADKALSIHSWSNCAEFGEK